MRVRDNFKENKKEELKDKIKVTVLAVAVATVPAATVYKIEQDKMDTMQMYYETLLEEEKENSYMKGFLDGLFGVEDNFFTPVDADINERLIETGYLVIEMPEKEKTLVYVKKDIKY